MPWHDISASLKIGIKLEHVIRYALKSMFSTMWNFTTTRCFEECIQNIVFFVHFDDVSFELNQVTGMLPFPSQNSAPSLLRHEECECVFLWHTAKACPLGESGSSSGGPGWIASNHTTEECTVRDIDSDFIFNMAPLRRKDSQVAYSVSDGEGKTYKVSLFIHALIVIYVTR